MRSSFFVQRLITCILLISCGLHIFSSNCHALSPLKPAVTVPPSFTGYETWNEFSTKIQDTKSHNSSDGFAYVVSGSLGLVGGLIAERMTLDPAEKLVFVLFQSIGIAAIGFGSLQWKVSNDDETLYDTLRFSNSLTEQQRTQIVQNYFRFKKQNEIRENRIKAVTFGLISLLNFYNGYQQKSEPVKNSLYFLGSVNLLACLSYSF